MTTNIQINSARDKFLTDFGKAVLQDRYLLEGETYQDLFARVAKYYSNDENHAQRIYDYMSQHWFMPATPILSNGGTERGLPISCFLNEVNDNLEGIVDVFNENVWLASNGGGIGSYWGNVRSIGEVIHGGGKTSGIIPFVKVQDTLTLAISQGNLRKGSSAGYLPVWHPEIEEFIELRRPTGGDPNRKTLNIHHGVVIDDKFMHAVKNGTDYELLSPKDGSVIEKVSARSIWIKILTARLETGEPYILFIDHVNAAIPEYHRDKKLFVKTSNLCSEITLPTGLDFNGKKRTAVCCLSSLNLEYFEEWSENDEFIYDIMMFLDNVLEDFIAKAPDSMSNAKYSAMRERSVGLGVMGFHSFLQSKMIAFESVIAKAWNNKIFSYIKDKSDAASVKIAKERGSCPDAGEILDRFANKTAIAPTASISIICGGASPGIEPFAANSFVQKTLTGSFAVRNKHLRSLLEQKGKNSDSVWSSITTNEGSVQHLEFLSDEEKSVFKTAYEMNQKWIIDLAADRTAYVSQAQSLNIFLVSNIHKKDLHQIHFSAWEKGVKSLYYCRSQSLQRSDKVSHIIKEDILENNMNDDDECLACQ